MFSWLYFPKNNKRLFTEVEVNNNVYRFHQQRSK